MKATEMLEKWETYILTRMREDKQRELQKQHETLESIRNLSTETVEIEAVLLKKEYKYRRTMGILELFMAFVAVYLASVFLTSLKPVVDVAAEALYVSWTVILALLVFLLVLMFIFLRNNVDNQSRIYHQLLLVEMVRKEKGMASGDLLGLFHE